MSYTNYTYKFDKGKDSGGGDIKQAPNLVDKIDDLKNICNADPTCLGFNSNGWLKKKLNPLADNADYNKTAVSGFYTKTDSTCSANLLSDGYLSTFCLNTDVRTKDNIIADIITAEKSKNTLFVFYKIADYKTLNDSTFVNPEYIQYRSGVEYTVDKIPLGNLGPFALKISTFITIPKGGLFNLKLTKSYGCSNVYIDNILIGKQDASGAAGSAIIAANGIYISEGIHYLYIETTSDNAYSASYKSNQLGSFALNVLLNPQGASETSVNVYITTPYTLMTNISTAKNNADINYCKAGAMLTNDYCKALIKTKTLLNDNINSYCLDPTTNKFSYSPECLDLLQKSIKDDSSINRSLKTTNTNNVMGTYNKSVLAGLDKLSPEDMAKFKDLYIMINDTANAVDPIRTDAIADMYAKLADSSGKMYIPTYCENTVGDVYNIENNKNTLCNYIYNNSNYQKSQPIKDSINNIRRNYCTKKVGDKFRYETEAQCQDMIKSSSLLNTDINNRCIVNGKFNVDDPYCNNLVDTLDQKNLPTNKDLFTGLTTSKINYMKDEITNISKDKPTLKTLDYATNIYKSYPTAKPADDILQPSLLNYCEIEDPMLSSNINTCKNIYNAYGSEPKVKDSRARMRFSNCTKSDYMMTNNNTDADIAKNINQCTTLVSDINSPANLSIVAPKMNDICSQGDNIVTDTCKNFYNNVESKFLDQFKTKSSFIGGRVEYANEVDPNSTETDTNDNSEKKECNSYEGVLLFMLFMIFILLGVMVISNFSERNNSNRVIPKVKL